MRFTRIAAVAALGIAAVVGSSLPAQGHSGAAAFAGTASTSGTWAPASPSCGSTPCPDINSWSFGSTTDVVNGTLGSGRVSGAGTFTGWCGRSTGSGTFSLDGDSGSISWQSAGTIIVLTGSITTPGHTGAAAAVVAARAATGTGNCVTAPATAFDVVGVAAGA